MVGNLLPIVLVGGQSRRFGRDKLREPVGEGWLVDRPIAALREVFGPTVAAVGDCHPEVAARADLVIRDRYPGMGPIGGILSALESGPCDVFVLPGDLPLVRGGDLEPLLGAAEVARGAWAILAKTTAPEPCIGIYRQAAAVSLRRHMQGRQRSLHDALPPERVAWVPVGEEPFLNLNTPLEEPFRGSP